MQSPDCVFHFACGGYWECGCDRDVLQEGTREIYGSLDADGYSRCSSRSVFDRCAWPLADETNAGPLIFGFVANRAGYRWIFWLLAIINGGQFILYLFFGAETRYIAGDTDKHKGDLRSQYFSFRRIDPTPLRFSEFYHPLTLAIRPTVFIPAFAYAMVFLFGSVLITVEVPQLLQEKFGLNAEQLGLQFLGVIIGTILGEQIGGSMSDFWMNRRTRKLQARPEPEYRLWLSYPGVILTIIGVIVFLVCTQQAPKGHWQVSPIVGTAIAAFGNQVVTTVLVTYAVDSYPQDSGSVGVYITFVRQIWGFIGPFWYGFPLVVVSCLLTCQGSPICSLMLVLLRAQVLRLPSCLFLASWLSLWCMFLGLPGVNVGRLF